MANSVSHASLPYPIKNARFTVFVPFLDADGDPTDPTTPDTEVSQDGGSYADAAEEVSTITGSNGSGYVTLTGAETNNSVVGLAFKVASGPKATLMALYPRNLPIISSGTLSAGSAGGGTLQSALGYDITGCFIRTTGGTGGGGTGGANNQARRIITYTQSSGAFTVSPNWETTPSTDTTYDVLLPEGATFGALKALNPTTAGRTLDVTSTGEAGIDWANIGGPTTSQTLSGTTVGTATAVTTVNGLAANVITATAIQNDAITAAKIATGAIDADAIADNAIDAGAIASDAITAAKIATGAITAAKFAAGAIDAAALAADAGAEIADAVWDEATSGHATAGTYGLAVSDILTDTGTTLQGELDGIQADTEDIQSRLPAALVGGRMDSSVGAMAANVMTAAAAAADLTTEIQNGLATAAALATAQADLDILTGADGAVIASGTQTFNMTGNITGNLSGSVGSVTGAVGSVTGAVGSVTGNVGGNVTGSVGSVVAEVTPTTASKTGYRLSATGVDDVLDEVVLGSYTMRQLLRGIAAMGLGKLSGAATTTITIRSADDTKDVVIATVDADGNRSAVTLDLT